MTLLLDTTILIDHLRGVSAATELISEAVERGEEIWSVTVVRTEVLAGARPNEDKPTKALLDSIRWVDVDVELADAAGRLARQYRKSHSGTDTVDYLLAAARTRLGAALMTTNTKHFPMVKDLTSPY